MAGPDYIVDITGMACPVSTAREVDAAVAKRDGAGRRPWLAVLWRCCSVYSRVYRNREATAYDGACPRCGKAVHVPIGPGGSSCRFFETRP